MLVNAGKWDELAEQCKRCENLRCLSLHMDGNHTYYCGKYPLKDSNEICPKFKAKKKLNVEEKAIEDCRNCKQYESCPCGKRGHENGTSIGYSIGECKDFEPKKD